MKNIAVFASGNGSNFQALLDSVQNGRLEANIRILVCDRPSAFVLERAKAAGIDSFVFSPRKFGGKEEYENLICEKLAEANIDWIVLAGYMRLLGPVLLSAYEGRIVNIHPSLLPAYPGKDAIGQALAAGANRTGVTVHFVDEGMDTGPAITQVEVPILDGETHESLQTKIQKVEHRLYPEVLQMLLNTQGESENGTKAGINLRFE
ncbi:phosphoribosylglycinamide formyltransferase [Neobacillus piezotolerans]|uniref:Phosphoribosylglycinamide formyltransferase n=1 Tax=Neobacillus piezotolerans TaxID=2259171 RepID=A0A3D8GKA0_9BACI|nr:phosphoribosylglycinamide formyltransferase [Neobacillus piezotolerans]RDU34679.1 phosphoribosylglycinamide formyltransferase [Neobacillus piezotolerans]